MLWYFGIDSQPPKAQFSKYLSLSIIFIVYDADLKH